MKLFSLFIIWIRILNYNYKFSTFFSSIFVFVLCFYFQLNIQISIGHAKHVNLSYTSYHLHHLNWMTRFVFKLWSCYSFKIKCESNDGTLNKKRKKKRKENEVQRFTWLFRPFQSQSYKYFSFRIVLGRTFFHFLFFSLPELNRVTKNK